MRITTATLLNVKRETLWSAARSIDAAANRRRGAPFDDIVGRFQAGIDPATPRIIAIAHRRQLEIERLPISIQNHVKRQASRLRALRAVRPCCVNQFPNPVRPSFTPCQVLLAACTNLVQSEAPLAPGRGLASAGARRAVSRSDVHRRAFASSVQSNQLISLSWQYALLLPCCVRRTSSPIESIGKPSESIVTVRKFFTCRFRSFSISGIIGGPFDTPIPASVVVRAVAVVFAIRLIVLLRCRKPDR